MTEAMLLHSRKKAFKSSRELFSDKKMHAFHLNPEIYLGYSIHLRIVQLNQPFCILPYQGKGYYYQVTATLYPKPSFLIGQLRLRSFIALPHTKSCHKALIKPQIRASAWCELPF